MSAATKASRTHLWLDTLGDWSWPGAAAEAVPLPPSWVPTFPPRLEPAVATAAPAGSVPWGLGGATPRRLLLGALLSALAAVSVALALRGPVSLQGVFGQPRPAHPTARAAKVAQPAPPAPKPLPALIPVSHDAAGSAIARASYHSPTLHGSGSFVAYLPPGYSSGARRYPVLYLLHGNSQPATAFLQIGLRESLDRLIAHHAIPPLIAVMIQGGRGANNWRDMGYRRYESYVLEVQQLIDRMLPTVAARSGRAIAGDSMGGFGAMNVALGNPYRFAVVESWLGFFDNLDGRLRADRPVISRLGLHAFLYGAESDTIANPGENPAFAAALRAAGASAQSAIYAGEHSLETLHAHLDGMLLFAGRAMFGAHQ